MAYILEKPCTNQERADFIVEYSHNKGLRIIPTETCYYALEENEVFINGEVVIDEEYYIKKEEEAKKKEAERIAMLNLTGADVERGIYKAKGMDFDDIIALVTQLQPEGLDIKALKIELKANNFYRGNSYVDAVGSLLGFTSEQLNKFFEYNDYTYLIPVVEETEEELPTNETVLPEEPTETEVI